MRSPRIGRWLDGWFHSDLIGIPFTLAAVAIIVVSVGLYVVIGKVAGLFVGKLLFILGFGGRWARSCFFAPARRDHGGQCDGPRR